MLKGRSSQLRELRLYKVNYHLNLLSSMSQEDGKLIDAIADSDELDIFETDLVMDLVDFKWEAYAKKVHFRGLLVHTTYILTLTMYIRATYLGETVDLVPSKGYLGTIALCLLYPLIYDGT